MYSSGIQGRDSDNFSLLMIDVVNRETSKMPLPL